LEKKNCYKINLNKSKQTGVYKLSFSRWHFNEKHKITIKGGIQEKELL